MGSAEGTLVQNDFIEESRLSRFESARMFMPGWLIHAFESTFMGDCDLHVAATTTGLLRPRFDAGELVFLSLLLGELQEQYLSGDSPSASIKLSFDVAKGHLSRFDQNHRERMLRVFESLCQLRFIVGEKSSGFDAISMFSRETWSLKSGQSVADALTLDCNTHTGELLTGLFDVHSDLLRVLEGGRQLSHISCRLKPLVIWTPVWLELPLTEQLVYLRMETVMQTHGSWLRLDGLTGAPIEYLTKGIGTSKRYSFNQAGDQQSGMLENLRIIGRLGRRLVSHGVIRKSPANGYMATECSLTSGAPSLLWQASNERLKSKDEVDYLNFVAQGLFRRISASQMETLISVFAGVSGDQNVFGGVLTRIWEAIGSSPGAAIHLAPGLICQLHLLFLEWIARSNKRSLLPLPKWAREANISDLVGAVSPENASRCFQDFCQYFSEENRQRAAFEQSLSDHPISIALIKNDQVKWFTQLASFTLPGVKISKKPTDLGGLETSEYSLKILSAESASNLEKPSAPTDTGTNLTLDLQKLQKLARQELEKMIYSSPSDYVALKRKYISSLDSETRSMVLNVERRLDSRDFDRQLRSRLVRFMVDNPTSWTSVNSRLPI